MSADKDNEIILSIEHLYEMFSEDTKTVSELLNTTEIYTFLTNSNLKLDLLQNNSYSNTDEDDISIANDLSVKVVGVLDAGNRLFVSENINGILKNYLDGYDSVYFYNSDNSSALESKIIKLKENDESIMVGNNLIEVENTKSLSEIINGMSSVFTAFTIVFLVLSFIVCLNYMNILVRNRNKELTLYRTLGAKRKDICKIFVFESLNISFKSIIGGIVGAYIITRILNNVLSGITLMKISNVNILNFDLLYCLLTLICVFTICLLASYLSIRSLLKKKLVEAFKEG